MDTRGAYEIEMPAQPDKIPERHEYWTEFCNARVLRGRHTFHRGQPYDVSTLRQESRRYTMQSFQMDGYQKCTRTAAHIATDDDEDYRLFVLSGGRMISQQGDAEGMVNPGMAVLASPAMPLTLAMEDIRGRWLRIPRTEINARLARKGIITAPPMPITTGLGRVVVDMMGSIFNQRASLTENQFDILCDHVTEIYCMLLVGGTPSGTAPYLIPQIRRYVRSNAANPDLTLGEAAAEMSCSTRHLQMALQQNGTTYRNLVREERLRLARWYLESSEHQSWTIDDIAIACGFGSGNALYGAYKSRFGEAPSVTRAQARHR